MRYEIERKFLVSGFLGMENPIHDKYTHYYQEVIYLSTDPEVRIKKTTIVPSEHRDEYYTKMIQADLLEDSYYTYEYVLTIKGDGNLIRLETEDVPVSKQTYDISCSLANGGAIRRDIRRYELSDGYILDIVHVLNGESSFYYAEVEFDSEEQSENWDSSILKDIIVSEVTFDPSYKMKNIWKKSRDTESVSID